MNREEAEELELANQEYIAYHNQYLEGVEEARDYFTFLFRPSIHPPP